MGRLGYISHVLLIFQPNLAMNDRGNVSWQDFQQGFFFTCALHYCCKNSNSYFVFACSWRRNTIALICPVT